MNGAGDLNQQPTSGNSPTCAEISELLVFYSCNEVSPEEKSRVDEHLAACAECREQLAQENLLVDALSAVPLAADLLDSSGVLLAQCRSELAEKIDDLHAPVPQERWQPFGWLRRWMALRPVWSGAALVVFGVVLGTQLLPWLETANDVAGPAVNVLASQKLTDDQLSKMAVANIHVSPEQGGGTDNIQLHLNAEQPLVLSGSVDDHDVRRVLNFVVSNGERSNTDVRLDCIDALRARANDSQVRRALLQAARKDPNVAIRIKALEALRDAADDDAVRATLLGVLDHDASPGVRIEAVNLLVRAVELDERNNAGAEELGADSAMQSGTDSVQIVTRALTDLAQKDPSRDVRLRSAAALRQLGARVTR